MIVNIDAPDVNDDLAVVEYVDDIYMFYKLTEVMFLLYFSLSAVVPASFL